MARTIPTRTAPVGTAYRHTRDFLALPAAERPTAIFATCDILAAGALQAIYQAGMRVPEDISLIGFDDTLAAQSGAGTDHRGAADG